MKQEPPFAIAQRLDSLIGQTEDAPAAWSGDSQQLLKSPSVIGTDNLVSMPGTQTIKHEDGLPVGPARGRLELDDQQPLTLKGGVLHGRGRGSHHPAELHVNEPPRMTNGR